MFRDLINPKTIGSDIVAGLTLGIANIPDAMASAILAGTKTVDLLLHPLEIDTQTLTACRPLPASERRAVVL